MSAELPWKCCSIPQILAVPGWCRASQWVGSSCRSGVTHSRALLVLPMVLKLQCKHKGGCRKAAPSLSLSPWPSCPPSCPRKMEVTGREATGAGPNFTPSRCGCWLSSCYWCLQALPIFWLWLTGLSSCCSHFLLSLALPGCFQLLQFATTWVTPLEWKAAKALPSRSLPLVVLVFLSRFPSLTSWLSLCQA